MADLPPKPTPSQNPLPPAPPQPTPKAANPQPSGAKSAQQPLSSNVQKPNTPIAKPNTVPPTPVVKIVPQPPKTVPINPTPSPKPIPQPAKPTTPAPPNPPNTQNPPVAIVPTVPTVSAPTPPLPGNPSAPTLPAVVMTKQKDVAADKKRFLVGCFGGFLGLFVVFIILMVFVLSRAGADNAVLQAFNLDPANLRQFLLGVVGFSFGFISLILLALTAVGIFRFTGAKKEDKFKRQSGVRLTLFSFIFLLIVLSVWLFLFNFINNLSLQAQAIPAEITIVEPKDLNNLQAPVEITFSALGVAQNLENSGLSIEKMEWDLDGDGEYETPAKDPEVVQLYTRRGFYNVSLKATITGEETPRIYQRPLNISQATFKTTPNTGTAPLTVQFDAADLIPADTRIQRFDWDFDGDGTYEIQSENAEQSEYQFTQIGDYQVHLRMLNVQGNVENYFKTITVTNSQIPLIEAKIKATPGLEGIAPFQAQFSAELSTSLKGSITSYVWNFGDGSAEVKGKSVSHTYQKEGTFDLVLKVEDDLGNQDEQTVQVLVGLSTFAPVAVIATSPIWDAELNQLKGNAPFKVMFDASKSTDRDKDIVEYTWDFNNDGKADALGEKTEYTFPEPGEFTAKLKVEDSQGQQSEAVLSVQVTQPPLLAVIEAQPTEGTPPLMVSFDGSASRSSEGRIVSYEWNFGDGTAPTITGALITHQYSKVGNYSVVLKVTTEKGETAQATFPVFVREVPLEACFTLSRKQGPAPLGVSFDVKCSTGTIAKYQWNFGDGSSASSFNPSHTFASPGVYTVTLTISDTKNNVSTYSDIVTAEGKL